MRWPRPLGAAAGLLATLLLASCGGAVDDAAHEVKDPPSAIETIDGSDLVRVTLTERAAERIDLQTTTVGRAGTGLVVPSTAVIVDVDGTWWVYTRLEPLTFVRHEIGLARQDGGTAFLSSGPPVGTEIVTVGVAELSGAEADISH